MKTFILLVCAFSVIGLLGELFYRMVEEKGFKSLKLLLMLPIYGIACGIMSLVYMIPCFKNIIFLPLFMLIGGIVTTGVELGFGLLYNKILKLSVWNYNAPPLNVFGFSIPMQYQGQICVKHSILYIMLIPLVAYFDTIIRFLAN